MADLAFAEPSFQVPQPLVLRVMGWTIKADDDSDEVTSAKMSRPSLS
jgi:hypothetical protein